MDDYYEPELGQAVWGQPWQAFDVPEIVTAALSYLSYELERVTNNIGDEYTCNFSPFANTGHQYKTDVFEVVAYSWDDEAEQPYNFKWRDIKISWYKYLGRGMSANKKITPDEASDMLMDCLKALRKIEDEKGDIW